MKFSPRALLPGCLLTAVLMLSSTGCKKDKETDKKATDEKTTNEKTGDEKATDKTDSQTVDDHAFFETIKDLPASEQAQATAAEMHRKLEAGNYVGFVEHHFPEAEVKRMRDNGNMEQQVVGMQKLPTALNIFHKFSGMLKAAQGVTPVLSSDGKRATFDVTFSEGGGTLSRPNLHSVGDIELQGYSGELNEVFTQAIADLEAEQYADFITKLFPEAELKRLKLHNELDYRVAQLKHSQQKKGTDPRKTMVGAMLADLNALQKLTPTINGETATYTLKRAPVVVDGGMFDAPEKTREVAPRTIIFQKVGSHWRFSDPAAKESDSLAKLRSLPEKGMTRNSSFVLVHTETGWRISFGQ